MNSPLFCSYRKNIGPKVSRRKNIRRLLQLCGERMKEGGEKEEAIMQISQFFFLAAPQDPILSSHYTHRDQSIFMGPTPRLSRIEKKAKIIKSFLLVPNKIWKLKVRAKKEEPIFEFSLFSSSPFENEEDHARDEKRVPCPSSLKYSLPPLPPGQLRSHSDVKKGFFSDTNLFFPTLFSRKSHVSRIQSRGGGEKKSAAAFSPPFPFLERRRL